MATTGGGSDRPRLFADVQHGLCNRLRVMASAAGIAQRTGRELVVIWRPDHHCAARIGDLLIWPGPVIEDAAEASLCRQVSGRVYNHMEIEPDSRFGEPVLGGADAGFGGDVYVRSAYWLTGPHRCPREEEAFLRRMRPAPEVAALLAGVRHPNRLAVHVRMGTGPAFDHLPHEAPANWPAERHRELTHWRNQSHVDRFVARIEELEAEGLADTLFVACDTADAYDRFAGRFGDRAAMLRRDLYDRSAAQLQYALADLMLLTSAERFLASSWSSFSEVAGRIARPGRPTERSGMDF